MTIVIQPERRQPCITRSSAARSIKLFKALGRGDVGYAVAGMAPRFEHIFPGDHALGGVRHTSPGIRAWLERLFRVLPGLSFEIKHIAVSGWPWTTTVAASGATTPR